MGKDVVVMDELLQRIWACLQPRAGQQPVSESSRWRANEYCVVPSVDHAARNFKFSQLKDPMRSDISMNVFSSSGIETLKKHLGQEFGPLWISGILRCRIGMHPLN
jgi:hypothetical protein